MSVTQTPFNTDPVLPGVALPSKAWIHDHWRLFLAEGVLLLVLGTAAILLPPLAGVATTVILGWIFLVAGIVGLASTLRAREQPAFAWSLGSAILALLAGLVLLWNPLVGLVTLTYVLTAYFIADGIFMIFLAISHRKELSSRWEWMLVSGVVDLVLAAIILSGMPGDVTWVLGMLVGIDLLFAGWSLVAMALAARKPI
jgi:uncharacterized membrane protein HdeD (DUF308 family)